MLLQYLRPRRLLLILDNCEHIIDEVAHVADAILRAAPQVRLLATSREPLRIDGEHVYRVPSLAVPQAGDSLTADRRARVWRDRVVRAASDGIGLRSSS